MKLEPTPTPVEVPCDAVFLDADGKAAHALRNILTVASFHEPEDDPHTTLAAIRSIARRALFNKTS